MNVIRIIKNNKKIIIISSLTSLITAFVIILSFLVLVLTKTITINGINSQAFQADQLVPTGTAAEASGVIDAVKKANPAVVSIIITKDLPKAQSHNPLDFLFNTLDSSQNDTKTYEIGGGSGFFVSPDGYIVTNKHVVDDSSADYTVITNDSKEYKAKILAKDPSLDVAILKVDGDNFPYLTFADSNTIEVGQTAIVIGNALAEFRNSVSSGIVSGLSRSIVASDGASGGSEQLDEVIQTDAAINPGNSGGPLLDIKGNVIGVNVAIENSAQNIGFSLPSNVVKGIADSVRQSGEITRPYVGVRYVQITKELAQSNKLPVDYGILVSKGESGEAAVISGSPAAKAGIINGDIILEIDGVKLNQTRSFASIIRDKKIGETVTLKLIHKGTEKEVKIKLEKAPNGL